MIKKNNPSWFQSDFLCYLINHLHIFTNRPLFFTGITPYISNEVGVNIESTFDELEESDLRNAVAGSTKVKLHQIRNRNIHSAEFDADGKPVKVAFPNDRAQSIRPFNRTEQYQ